MSDINKLTFVKLDNTYGRLVTDNISILESVFKRFAVPVENYWFMPAYRAGRWDGKIHFVQRDGKFYIGTFKLIYNYVNTGEYEIDIDPELLPERIEKDELVSKFMLANEERLNPKFIPYVYQTRGALKSLYHKRAIMEHCTSSGKSLTIFLVVNYLLKYNPNHKILILVPKLDLVEQITENLIEFGLPPDLVGKFCGFQKDTDEPVIVSTWQSMHKQKKFLKEFTVFIADEAHGLKADIVRSVAENMINADIRLGFTGTMPDSKSDYMLIEGVLGPVVDRVMPGELIKLKKISDIQINILNLKYPQDIVTYYEQSTYESEKKFIETNENRNKAIVNVAKKYASMKKNTLILVKKIEHGETLLEMLKERNINAHMVCGDTKINDRNHVRHEIEKSGGNVVVATVGVYSTGVSIKRLHCVIFAAPGKSKIQTLQSVGRGLRKHESKKKLQLYDFAENLKFSSDHLKKRLKFYEKNDFPFTVKDIDVIQE